MNLQSGNDQTTLSQEKTALDKLKAASRTTVRAVTEQPYLPTVYAIPTEDWAAFQNYLREVVTFQPELYRRLSELATKRESLDQTMRMWREVQEWGAELTQEVTESAEQIIPQVQTVLTETRDLLAQDGRTRDEFLNKLKWAEETRLGRFEELLSAVKKRMLWVSIGTGVLSALISAGICLLMK